MRKPSIIYHYSPGANPYQKILVEGLEKNGLKVKKIKLRKLFSFLDVRFFFYDFVHFDWVHDLYSSNNKFLKLFKMIQFHLTINLMPSKVSLTVHNVVSHNGTHEDESKFINLILSKSKALFYLSPSTKKDFEKLYPLASKISSKVVFHPIYETALTKPFSKKIENCSHEKEKSNFLVFGRLNKYKKIDDLIKLWNKNHIYNRLTVIGNPESASYKNSLQNLKNNNEYIKLIFKKFSDDDLVNLAIKSDTCIINSHSNANSGTAYAAMSMGMRIIAPNTQYFKDLKQFYDDIFMFDHNVIEKSFLDVINQINMQDMTVLKRLKNIKQAQKFYSEKAFSKKFAEGFIGYI